MKVDILAFGVHPDDVELSCSGTLINEIKLGKRVTVVDLTQGELGTRGTAETRAQEAADAARIMGIQARENLGMRDGFFQNDEAHQRLVIQAIRKYQPDIVLANVLQDRHPDHGRAGQLVREAAFLSGLSKIETTDATGQPQDRWRPAYVLHYIQDSYHEPDLVVDISDSFDQRMESIKAYKTQFLSKEKEGPQTYISSPDFYDSIIARSRLMGKRIGVKYAEGFIAEKKIGVANLNTLLLRET
ncbi:MAG: bacillithiol biosynthesis deacetylase BshB1 [Bacteroidota bacterium]